MATCSELAPEKSHYAVFKFSLWGLSKLVVIENAALNITINNINFEHSELGMIEMVPDEGENVISQIPAGIRSEPRNILIKKICIYGSSIDLRRKLV